jgi:large subunit ribosomal protein L44e
MKIPEDIRNYCPFCRKHTMHDVRVGRKGKERTMNRGRRKYKEIKKGYGGSPRTPKKPVNKLGKRTLFLFKCKECGKTHQKVHRARTKKPVEVGKN